MKTSFQVKITLRIATGNSHPVAATGVRLTEEHNKKPCLAAELFIMVTSKQFTWKTLYPHFEELSTRLEALGIDEIIEADNV